MPNRLGRTILRYLMCRNGIDGRCFGPEETFVGCWGQAVLGVGLNQLATTNIMSRAEKGLYRI